MKLLMIAESGKFDDGTPLAEHHRQSLATAALHLFKASNGGKHNKDSAANEMRILDDICGSEFGYMSPVFQKHEKSGIPDWTTPMLTGLKHIDSVASELIHTHSSSHSVDTLKEIFKMTVFLYSMMLISQISEDTTPYAHMLSNPYLWMTHSLNYGCVRAEDLSSALVWRSIIAADIPEISKIEDDSILRSTLEKAASKWETLDMAKTLAAIGIRWLEGAEAVAAKARSASTWSEVLMSTSACHMFYWTAKRALLWSKSVYRKLNLEVPYEVWKEHQMVEEYQADGSSIFLTMYGWRTIYGPIFANMFICARAPTGEKLNTGEIRTRFINAVYSQAGRTPDYPRALLQSWRRVAEHIHSQEDISVEKLEPFIQQEFLAAFPDKPVIQATLGIAARFQAHLQSRSNASQNL